MNDNKYEPNEFDEDIGAQGEIKKDFCGENRYRGLEKILEFYLEAGCQIKISDVQTIQTAVRLDINIDDFFSGGGVTSFTDNIAGALGIHASNIKIVSVYEGSVVVDYYILADDDDEDPEATLAAMETVLITALNEGTIDLGAPVLEATVTSSTGTVSEPVAAEVTVTEEEEVDEESEEEIEVASIDIQFEEETSISEVIETPLEAITKNTDKFYVIIICLIPMTLIFTVIIIMARKHFGQKKQNQREIDQVREVSANHQGEKAAVEEEDQYVPDIDFDIFGMETPAKSKKDLKNQD